MSHSNKQPKQSFNFSQQKIPRSEVNPDDVLNSSPAWMFKLVDINGPWAFNKDQLYDYILPKLQEFEGMTWKDIESQSGGRKRGTNSHFIPINDLCRPAQKILDQRFPDVDQLFSLRIGSTKRIFGIRELNVLKIIWYDPDHEICPVSK